MIIYIMQMRIEIGLEPIFQGRIKKKLMMKSPISQRGGPNDSQSWECEQISDIWLCDWLLHTRLEKCTIRVNSEMITFSFFSIIFQPPHCVRYVTESIYRTNELIVLYVFTPIKLTILDYESGNSSIYMRGQKVVIRHFWCKYVPDIC